MKHFKIGLAGMVAILAMSFTIVANADIAKGKLSAKRLPTCYVNQPPKATCSPNNYPSDVATPLNPRAQVKTINPVCVTTPSNTTTQSNPDANCNSNFGQICCYLVTTSEEACAECPGTVIGEVTSVYFKNL